MQAPARILVFHTAFIGDIILALPMIQSLHSGYPGSRIDVVTIPSSSEVLRNHPAISDVIVYDKRGADRGFGGIVSLAGRLHATMYDLALIPHRSIRSALIGWLARIPRRIGFSTSAGRLLFSDLVRYEKSHHEVRRNLDLLKPLGIENQDIILPSVYPDHEDCDVVDRLMGNFDRENLIALAPGSIWNTKRWTTEGFIELGRKLLAEDFSIVLVGGKADQALCREICGSLRGKRVLDSTGELTLLQSAELIRRCRLAVSNDSAPMHLAVAVRTPVVAIFGATVPQFGFAPLGEYDEVVETPGLSCRPCSIHGGRECPIKTFVCMKHISTEHVLEKVYRIMSHVRAEV
jgi:heptosyltransferase-2